jgi:hypothetical protein
LFFIVQVWRIRDSSQLLVWKKRRERGENMTQE